METGREQGAGRENTEESWKEELANNIELGLGPTQGHSPHSKRPRVSVSKHKTPKKQGLLWFF